MLLESPSLSFKKNKQKSRVVVSNFHLGLEKKCWLCRKIEIFHLGFAKPSWNFSPKFQCFENVRVSYYFLIIMTMVARHLRKGKQWHVFWFWRWGKDCFSRAGQRMFGIHDKIHYRIKNNYSSDLLYRG